MKLSAIFLITFLIDVLVYAQQKPESFYINEEIKLQKSSAETPASNSISDLIVSGDTIWAGTGKGVSLSTDNGANWTNFTGTAPFGNESVSAIGYYNGVFWAATAHSVERDGQSLPEGSGLHYTTDMGNTWTSVPQPRDNQADTVVMYGDNAIRATPVTVSIQNLVYDIAFTPGTVWIAAFAGGLRKSTDMGATWQRVVIPPDYLRSITPEDTLNFCLQPVSGRFCVENNLNHRVFSVISTDDTTLYAGTAAGINKSTDGGVSWIKFNSDEDGISGNFVVALGYNNFDNTVWGATWRAEASTEFYGVSFSPDGGESWNTALAGERPHNFGFKKSHVLVPTDNGVFRSSNQGTTWIQPGIIKDNSNDLVLQTSVFYSASASDDYVWLGSGNGLARLKESGTWQGEWKIYFASRQLSSSAETYSFPNPYSPKNDTGLRFKYTTEGETKKVTIRIYDFGMNYIRTVIQNAERTLDESEVEPILWNGKDDNGTVVPNGVYFYMIEVEGKDPMYGKVIVLQ